MIELTEITPRLIGNFLKSYAADPDIIPEPLNSLRWLAHHEIPHERAFQLFYRLEAWTQEELGTARQQAGLPPLPLGDSPAFEPVTFLRESFSQQHTPLEKWAAVYLRYFIPHNNTIKSACAAAGVNVRRFYRRRDEGLAALTRLVTLLELQIRQENSATRLLDRLPPRDYSTLIGRDQIIQTLRSLFDDPHGPRMISLEGLAGEGKTAIARQLATDLARYNLIRGLAWVKLAPDQAASNGQPSGTMAAATEAIVEAIHHQLGDEAPATALSPAERVSRLRDQLITPYYLVVLDGLEALEDPADLVAVLRPLTPQVLFVFTTRQSLGACPEVAIIPVGGLSEAQCHRVLKDACDHHQVTGTLSAQQFQALYHFSAGAPGFMVLVAEHLRHNAIQTLLEQIEQHSLSAALVARLDAWFEPQLSRLAPDPALHSDSLMIILALSCTLVNGDKRDWLRLVTGLPDARYNQAENVLAAHYFLLRYAATDTVCIPLLLRTYLQSKLLGLWKSQDWAIIAQDPRRLRWLKQALVRLRRALRHTTAHLDRVDRATLFDGQQMERYYALLNAAHFWEALAEPALEIILKLHPLPIYNGDWRIWEREIAFASQELEKRQRIPEQAGLLVDLQTMLFHTGRWKEVLTIFEQIWALREAHHLPVCVARSLYNLVNTCFYMNRHEQVSAQVDAVMHSDLVAGATGDDQHLTQVWLCLTRSHILRYQGQLEAALDQALEAEAQLRACNTFSNALWGQIRQHQGLMFWTIGRYDVAESYLHEVLDIFQKQEDIFSQSFVEGKLGLLYWSRGQLGEAEKYTLGSIHAARLHGADWHLTGQIGNLALVLLYRGELELALEHAEEHYQLAVRMGVVPEINRATVNRGAILFHLNREQDALDSLKHGLGSRELDPESQASLQLYLARYYAARGQFNTAIPYLDEVQQTMDLTGSVSLQISLNRVRAEVLPGHPEARDWLQKALVLAEDLKRDFDRAACLLALASLPDAGSKQQVYWNSGKALLSIAGAERWLAGAHACKPLFLPTLL